MSAYRKDFDETKYMFFLIKNGALPDKYNIMNCNERDLIVSLHIIISIQKLK